MNKNTERIKAGLKKLAHRDNELVSGTVVGGSVNMSDFTCSVLAEGDNVITKVLLSSVTENGNGVILVPADGSNVIIGSIDGPGVYFIVRTSNLAKVIATIDQTVLAIDDSGYKITRGSETLTKLLKDLLNALIKADYTNGAGTTSPANNLPDFQDILNRIDNLLT